MATFLLSQSDGSESEMGLALNRYIGNSILPALISHSSFYAEAEAHAPLLDATLHTVYRLSKCKVGKSVWWQWLVKDIKNGVYVCMVFIVYK